MRNTNSPTQDPYTIEIAAPQATTFNFEVIAASYEQARAIARNMGHEPLSIRRF